MCTITSDIKSVMGKFFVFYNLKNLADLSHAVLNLLKK